MPSPFGITGDNIAGTGAPGSTGDNGPAVVATLNEPVGVALSSAGDLCVTEYAGNSVRKIRRP